MNLYKQYLKEREGLDVYELPEGFIIYKIDRKTAFINDYYVAPEHRQKGIGYKLADHVFIECKEKNIGAVFCQSDERGEGHDISRLSILNYGFKEYERVGPVHHYVMEVSKWERL